MPESFVFSEDQLDGVRVIRLSFPHAIDKSSLAAASAAYLSLWDDERPTVGLGDASRLEAITPEVLQILAVFAKRVAVLPNFVGASWYTGRSREIEESLRALAAAAGRDPKSVVVTRREAEAYLRARIVAWRQALTMVDSRRVDQ
jgi:hypothetical protein